MQLIYYIEADLGACPGNGWPVSQSASDQDGLLPLLDATAANTGRLPDEVSADNGLVERNVRGYVATGRAKHPAAGKSNAGPLTVAMRRRLRQGGHRSRYRLRKHIVEPMQKSASIVIDTRQARTRRVNQRR